MEAWNQAWATAEGRADWLQPEPFVQATLATLRAAGVRRVLDLGFGVGRHGLLLARSGFAVNGIDASANGLDFATQWAAAEGVALTLTTGDMARLPYADGEFDAVLTWNVIYHGTWDVIELTVAEIERCLRPQGHLVCSFISTHHFTAGQGVEIEPHTYVIPGGGERETPHHYFDYVDVTRALHNFTLLRCEDAVQKRADDYHWHILAQRRA